MARNYQKDKSTKTKNAAEAEAHSSAAMMQHLFRRQSVNNNSATATVTPAVNSNEDDARGMGGISDLDLNVDDTNGG